MADLYANFKELAANEVLGKDYEINSTVVPSSKVLIAAIHGGGIEAGSSELAEYLSEKYGYSSYRFDATKSSNNTSLHVTSTHFDEPTAVRLNAGSYHSVFLHGYGDSKVKNTYVGGLDLELMEIMTEELNKAGFPATMKTPTGINGDEPDNICNRNFRGKGVQLEMSTLQRKSLFRNNDFSSSNRGNKVDEFYRLAKVIHKAISKNYKAAPIRLEKPKRLISKRR